MTVCVDDSEVCCHLWYMVTLCADSNSVLMVRRCVVNECVMTVIRCVVVTVSVC